MNLAAPLLALSLFAFQNNFWVNLHQFLYAEAGRQRAGQATAVSSDAWSEADRDAWTGALSAYAPMASRNIVFDAGLVAVNDALSGAGDTRTLPAGVADPLASALTRAADVYRRRLWPQHQQTNAAWIAAMQPQVEQHEGALTQALAKAYGTSWPALPIRVDVSIEAGPVGAYTTDSGPAGFAAHATISPIGPGSEGAMGVETVFHEASHAVDAHIMQAVRDECARQQVGVPRNLWHAIIFYTTGELVRRELGLAGDARYMPYAYRFDVYSKGMTKERAALERNWQPYLDGKTTFDEALRSVVRDATR